MRKIVLAGVLVTVALCLVALTPAFADPPDSPPGQGDCSHGNSGQTCVPDPQPTNGQDCEEHGNNGGVNEDHCLGTTTTPTSPPTTTTTTVTEPPSPTSTVTESPTTTTTVTETPSDPTETPTTTDAPVPTDAPTTTTGGGTSTGTGPDGPSDSPKDNSETRKPSKLAFTGVEDVVPIGAASLILLTLGTGLLRAGSRRRSR